MHATKHKTYERLTSHATSATTSATNEVRPNGPRPHGQTHGHIARTEHGRCSTARASSHRLHTLSGLAPTRQCERGENKLTGHTHRRTHTTQHTRICRRRVDATRRRSDSATQAIRSPFPGGDTRITTRTGRHGHGGHGHNTATASQQTSGTSGQQSCQRLG